jgi:hypothetical protein
LIPFSNTILFPTGAGHCAESVRVVFTEKPDAPQQQQTNKGAQLPTPTYGECSPNEAGQEGDLEEHNDDHEAQAQDTEVFEPPVREFAKVRNLYSLGHNI